MREEDCAVQVRNLTVAYDKTPVLRQVNLALPSGALTAIVGPNGAGKTTLMKAMLGLLRPVCGEISFPNLPQGRRSIAYVPQSESVDWDFPVSVLDVVMMGCYGRLGWFRRPGKAEEWLARERLEELGMETFATRQISQLSGGQQQRVFLARALVQEAELYVMDEPFKGVDAQTEKSIIALLKTLKDSGKTVIAVHHDLHTVPEYFDFVALMNQRVIAAGAVAEVFSKENIHAAYRPQEA